MAENEELTFITFISFATSIDGEAENFAFDVYENMLGFSTDVTLNLLDI